MIIAYVGTPGSGKSYDAVRRIIETLRTGRKVWTNVDGLNVPSCLEAIKVYCNLGEEALHNQLHFLSKDDLPHFWELTEKGSMIVLDELHFIFGNREWTTGKNKEFGLWASVHRHEGYDLVLITQRLDGIESSVRPLVEWTYKYRKNNFFGSMAESTYLRFAYTGESMEGEPVGRNVCRYDKKIFRCYKSYAAADMRELGIGKQVNILKKPIFIAIPICFAVFFWNLAHSSLVHGRIFGMGTAKVGAAVSKPKSVALGPVQDVNAIPARAEGKEEKAVRISDVVDKKQSEMISKEKKDDVGEVDLEEDEVYLGETADDRYHRMVRGGARSIYTVHRDGQIASYVLELNP